MDLFLWLQTQDIAIWARHIPGCPNVIADHIISAASAHNNRVEPPPRKSDPDLQDVGHSNSEQACHNPQHASSPVYVSNLRPSSTGDRCSVTRLAGKVDVHVSTVPPTQQSHSKLMDHSGGLSDTNSLLVAITTVVSTSTLSCEPPSLFSVTPGPTVTTGICLGWQVVPSACLDALMQYYQAVGFSKRSLDLRQPLEDHQQTESMTTGCFISLTGPQDNELIRLVPQLLKWPLFYSIFLIPRACHLNLSKNTCPA